MWQMFALGSIFSAAFESIVDKAAFVAVRRVDATVATFWRLLFFTIAIFVIGFAGFFGPVHLLYAPTIFIVAGACIVNSLFYTILMKRIEVMSVVAIEYVIPFAYLFVDANILHTQFSPNEVAGIILLVLGGLGFALDGKTHRFKKELSSGAWAMFAFSVIFTGVQSYGFKYMYAAYGTNNVSFLASYGLLATVGLFIFVLLQGKAVLFLDRPSLRYMPRVALSKSFDAMGSAFWTQALTLAAVSQVSAMGALEPLAVFVVVVLAQDVLGIRIGEKLGVRRTMWKAASVSFLVLGGVLVT